MAACSDGATSPRAIAPNSVSIISISMDSSADPNTMPFFGVVSSLNLEEVSFGLHWVSTGENKFSTILEQDGPRATIGMGVNGARWIYPTSQERTSISFLSDWQPMDPQHHRGVMSYDTARVMFSDGGMDNRSGTMLPLRSHERRVRTGSVSVTEEIHVEDLTQRFVFPVELYELGCSRTDSLTFASTAGLGVVLNISTPNNTRREIVHHDMKTGRMIVHCAVYESVTAAKSALGAEILRSTSLTRRTKPHLEVKNGWATLVQ
ncbi:hypothetical protein KW790_00750 [Candidatus Parcubacteria bacterium]|nr:hypothetical protein [Candidatus Parcubacteria bacterium]